MEAVGNVYFVTPKQTARGDRAHDELSLSADIPDVRPKSDGQAGSDQHQRSGLEQQLGQFGEAVGGAEMIWGNRIHRGAANSWLDTREPTRDFSVRGGF